MSSKSMDLNIIEYKILTLDDLKAATNLQIKTSFQEMLTIGFGISEIPGGTDKEGFTKLLGNIIEDGISIGAFDTTNNQLVGVCFNKLHTKSELDNALEENVDENMKHPATLDLMKFIFKLESSIDIYDYYGINTAMELFYIGVDKKYRRYGIARKLMMSTIELAESMALDGQSDAPEVIYAVYTSNYSQTLGHEFNFDMLSTVRYDEYKRRDGLKLSDKIGNVHQTAKLGARRVLCHHHHHHHQL